MPAFVPSLGGGWPDRVLCVDGIFVGVELKRPGDKPTEVQLLRLRQIREAGGIGFWADDAVKAAEKIQYLVRGMLSFADPSYMGHEERCLTEEVHATIL